MRITPVLLRGGTLDGTIHHASTSFETWGLSRVPGVDPPRWELHELSSESASLEMPTWDYSRTVSEAELLGPIAIQETEPV